jgi:hypothetical protein
VLDVSLVTLERAPVEKSELTPLMLSIIAMPSGGRWSR